MFNRLLQKLGSRKNVSLQAATFSRVVFCDTHLAQVLPLYTNRFPSHGLRDHRRNVRLKLETLFNAAAAEISKERLRNALICFGTMPVIALTAGARLGATAHDPMQTLGLAVVIAAAGYSFWKAALTMDVYQRNSAQDAPLVKYNDADVYARAQTKLSSFLKKPDF